jgi:carbon monoxide dehydrogenase subunit G
MKVEGTRVFEAPREQVWAVLMDPARLAGLLPGIQTFEIEDERHWSAKVKVPLGLGSLALGFKFEKTLEDPPEHAALSAKGKGVGAVVSMETRFRLRGDGPHTAMDWHADIHVLGPVGSMGQRVLQPVVNQQVETVLNALESQVRQASASPADSDGIAQGGSPRERDWH